MAQYYLNQWEEGRLFTWKPGDGVCIIPPSYVINQEVLGDHDHTFWTALMICMDWHINILVITFHTLPLFVMYMQAGGVPCNGCYDEAQLRLHVQQVLVGLMQDQDKEREQQQQQQQQAWQQHIQSWEDQTKTLILQVFYI